MTPPCVSITIRANRVNRTAGFPEVLTTACDFERVVDFNTLKRWILLNPAAWTIQSDPDEEWLLVQSTPCEVTPYGELAYGMPANDLRCIVLNCLWREAMERL